jgi:hypothetical protein
MANFILDPQLQSVRARIRGSGSARYATNIASDELDRRFTIAAFMSQCYVRRREAEPNVRRRVQDITTAYLGLINVVGGLA